LLSRSAKIGIDARFTGYEFYHTLARARDTNYKE
jgi:hypothetical protein